MIQRPELEEIQKTAKARESQAITSFGEKYRAVVVNSKMVFRSPIRRDSQWSYLVPWGWVSGCRSEFRSVAVRHGSKTISDKMPYLEEVSVQAVRIYSP